MTGQAFSAAALRSAAAKIGQELTVAQAAEAAAAKSKNRELGVLMHQLDYAARAEALRGLNDVVLPALGVGMAAFDLARDRDWVRFSAWDGPHWGWYGASGAAMQALAGVRWPDGFVPHGLGRFGVESPRDLPQLASGRPIVGALLKEADL